MRSITLVVALALATVVASACGGSSPLAPSISPPSISPPTPTTPTASLSGVSAETRTYITTATSSRNMITRWADRSANDPIRVYGAFSSGNVASATNFWATRTGLNFRTVGSEGEAEIVLRNELPENLSNEACGNASFSGSPVITAGLSRVAIGLKPGCDPWATSVALTHELGHILGFGHTCDRCDDTEVRDIMGRISSAILVGSPKLDEAALWIHSAPPSAQVVQ